MKKSKNRLSGVNSLALTLGLTGLVVVGGSLMAFNESNRTRSVAQIEGSSNEAVLGVSNDSVSAESIPEASVLNKANFADIWRSSVSKGNAIAKVLDEDINGMRYASVQLSGGSLDEPMEASVYAPFNLPTKQNYGVFVAATVKSDKPANDASWVRLVTNQTTEGSYILSVMPKTQAIEIQKYASGKPTTWFSTNGNKSVKGVNIENRLQITKNPTTGLMVFYVNGTKVFQKTDKNGYVGGQNRLFLTSYTGESKALFRSLVVFKQ